MREMTLSRVWTEILALSAGLITLSKVWELIGKRIRPAKKLRLRVKAQEERLNRTDRAIKRQEEAMSVIFRALFAQINHLLSGNGDEILKKSRDELQNYLSERR